MDKKKIFQFQKKYAQEKKERERKEREKREKEKREREMWFRNSKENNYINVPIKQKYQEIQTKQKSSKKNLPKTVSAEKLLIQTTRKNSEEKKEKEINFDNSQQINYNKPKHHHKHKLKSHDTNIYINDNTVIKNNSKQDNNHTQNDEIFSYNLENKYKNICKSQESDNFNIDKIKKSRNNKIIKEKDEDEKMNIIKNNEFPETPNNLRSESDKKSNLTYSKFINNLKIHIEKNNNENEKIKNKKNKNVFANFLNQFVNKEQQKEDNENNNIKYFSENKLCMNNIIRFYILGNNNNKNEIIRLQKELDIIKNKNNELLKIIENKDNELKQINYNYNNIINENKILKEENNNLKNNTNKNNNNIEKMFNFKNDIEKEEKPKYNNLITYNINKNNNYNIINSGINNFNNIIQNNNINAKSPSRYNKSPTKYIKPLNINSKSPRKKRNVESKEKEIIKCDNENESEFIKNRKRKASRAFERFKRATKANILDKEGEIIKSDKISNMAKTLENQMEEEHEKKEKIDNEKNDNINEFNNNIINLIDSQPVVNKKRKKTIKIINLEV